MLTFIIDNSLLILLFLGTAFSCFWLLRHRDDLRISQLVVLILAVVHTLVGVICVKVFAVLETLDFDNAGSMSLFGAVFFLPVVYGAGAKLAKRSVATTFDVFTPCMVFTLLCARVNCLLSGCCLGQYVPWGSGARWPTRELEILFYIVLLVFLWREDRKDRIPGIYYPVYMIAYGAFRFFVEGFRASASQSIIHISHVWAVVSFCLGLSIYTEIQKKRRTTRRNKHA